MSPSRPRYGFLKYLRAAFVWRWNLLAFGAGIATALLSGHPDAVFALVAAAEIGYLGMLSTHPRFRKAIDARPAPKTTSANHAQLLNQIRAALRPEVWERFETLRDRCLGLDRLARQFRGPEASQSNVASEIQTSSLERLLWMFLKLLYSVDALNRFLRGTDREELVQGVAIGEKELETARSSQRNEKLLKSLEDKVETLRQRLANYDRAAENREFLTAELDRIEQKVNAIGEMSISAHDAADFSSQVDGITDGIAATEEAIRTLDVAPMLERGEPPPLLTQKF